MHIKPNLKAGGRKLEKVEGKILLLAHADLTKDHCDPPGRGKHLEILKGPVSHTNVRSESFFYKKIKILNTKKTQKI